MARNLSHLTGHELAALAAPFENPRTNRFRRNPESSGGFLPPPPPVIYVFDYTRVYRTSKGQPYVKGEGGRRRFISEAKARAIEKQFDDFDIYP